MLDWILISAGLFLFELVASIDNVIINADVLSPLSKKAKRWFMVWGLFFAVFFIRGLVPWFILHMSTPALPFWEIVDFALSHDPMVEKHFAQAKPLLMSLGGTFLLLVFFHWLFLEEKNPTFAYEKFFQQRGIWFFVVAASIVVGIIVGSYRLNISLALGSIIGSNLFFFVHGFKTTAEQKEKDLRHQSSVEMSKLVYLLVIDMANSIDSVFGAFAFTFSLLVIFFVNGFGALIIHHLTFTNIRRVRRYRFLKHGAMYATLLLGSIMLLKAFSVHVPEWIIPLGSCGVIAVFFFLSLANKKSRRHPLSKGKHEN
ncbi:MAG: DUF475 domain-containing protein [Brevinematales bacterium]|nr:DUF475 domain-containing protein [Brevinematales bacterium]